MPAPACHGQNRQFFALTQVCCTIRNELSHTCSSNTEGCVRDTNTDRYIDSVVVPPETALDEALDFVSIDFEKLGRFMSTEGFGLLFLVRLADAAPRLRISIYSDCIRDRILCPGQIPAFRRYIFIAVNAIELYNCPHGPEIWLQIKIRYARTWMKERSDHSNKGECRGNCNEEVELW